MEAPLQLGYYMIGRHKECQIRPKSRSVSRRHCLLHLHEGGLRVLDLDSAAGTYVDAERLQPRSWQKVGHGAMLRCGKMLFQVAIEQVKAGSADQAENGPVVAAASASGSILTGQAWQDVDVAGFLDAEDEAAREERYDNIRARHSTDFEVTPGEDTEEFDSDLDLDLFEEAFDDLAMGPATRPAEVGDASVGKVAEPASDADQGPGEPDAGSAAKAKDKSRRPAASVPEPKRTRNPKAARVAWSWRRESPLDLRLGLALLVTLATIGLVGYNAFQFYSGPSVRVLQNLD
jgi:predicted component of type VI protein secretion system